MSREHFFNIHDLKGGLDRNLAPGIDTTIFCGDQAMISVVRLGPGTKGQIHSHPEEQWGICQSGSGVRVQDGARIPVKAGDFWLTPGDVPHGIEAGEDGLVVMDLFAPPRDAYRKAGAGFAGSDT